MPTSNEIRQQVTDKLIAALEKGVRPWRRPWSGGHGGGRHTNVISRRAYSGINPLLLEVHALDHGLNSNVWGTFQQWQSLGASVKRRPDHVQNGRWGCHIIFYKPVTKTTKKPDTGEEEESQFLVMREFTVFNLDQVDGADHLRTANVTTTMPDFAPADELIAATKADIRHGGSQAFYRRPAGGTWPLHTDGDYIMMPPKGTFDPVGSYYETAFHELAHWSEVRLDWDWKNEGYNMGELRAEIAACQLAAELGVPQAETVENHAAYLKSWLSGMKSDPSLIFKVATQAGKAADLLLSFVGKNAEQPQPQLETAA